MVCGLPFFLYFFFSAFERLTTDPANHIKRTAYGHLSFLIIVKPELGFIKIRFDRFSYLLCTYFLLWPEPGIFIGQLCFENARKPYELNRLPVAVNIQNITKWHQ